MRRMFAKNMMLAFAFLGMMLSAVSMEEKVESTSEEMDESRKIRLTEEAFEKLRAFGELPQEKRFSKKALLILELILCLDIKEEILKEEYDIGCKPVTLEGVLKKLKESVIPYYSKHGRTELIRGIMLKFVFNNVKMFGNEVEFNKSLFAEMFVKLAEDMFGHAYVRYYEYDEYLPDILEEELVDDPLDLIPEIMISAGKYAPARRFAAVTVVAWINYMRKLVVLAGRNKPF